jgi:hypothetical protein
VSPFWFLKFGGGFCVFGKCVDPFHVRSRGCRYDESKRNKRPGIVALYVSLISKPLSNIYVYFFARIFVVSPYRKTDLINLTVELVQGNFALYQKPAFIR